MTAEGTHQSFKRKENIVQYIKRLNCGIEALSCLFFFFFLFFFVFLSMSTLACRSRPELLLVKINFMRFFGCEIKYLGLANTQSTVQTSLRRT